MSVPIDHVVTLSALLFAIGVVGMLSRRSLLLMLLSLELMLAAVNLSLVGFNRVWSATPDGAARGDGHVFALMVVLVAAAQTAVGLGVVVALIRNRDSLDVDDASLLRW